jgi:hypothetical protein
MNQQFPEHLFNIERKLWTNDAVFYKNNLTENCLLVFPETSVITRNVAVDEIQKDMKKAALGPRLILMRLVG